MVVVKIGDGLGNQMFNYACGYSVAKHDGDTLLLDTSEVDNSTLRSYGLDKFNIEYKDRESFSNRNFFCKLYKRLRRNLKYNVIAERRDEACPRDMTVYKKKLIRNKYLYGYFQNLVYLDNCMDDIRRQFTPSKPFSERAEELIKQLESGETCSVHIRGGDIEPLPYAYYEKAVAEILKKNGKVRFIFFSNVRELTESYEKQLNIDAVSVWELGDFTDIEELFLMKACKSHILSDSTFARWAALLDEKGGQVCAPYSVDAGKIYRPEWNMIDYRNEEVI